MPSKAVAHHADMPAQRGAGIDVEGRADLVCEIVEIDVFGKQYAVAMIEMVDHACPARPAHRMSPRRRPGLILRWSKVTLAQDGSRPSPG